MVRIIKTLFFCCLTGGLVALVLQSGGIKEDYLFKKTASSFSISTGVADFRPDSAKPAQFYAHLLQGVKFPNTLYQAFFAVHYEELDSVLTHHGAVGRTVSRRFPGDSNTLKYIQPFAVVRNARIDSISARFTLPGTAPPISIRQNLYALKDSSYRIYLDYIITTFPRSQPDTVRFTNLTVLFGYDGDIGSTLSGYNNDSCGYYRDDSVRLVYVYDRLDSLRSLYAGVQLLKGGILDSAGNKAMFHQTVNAYGFSFAKLDTLLYNAMAYPKFDPNIQNTDQWIYWSVKLGDRYTSLPADTMSDTLRFVLLNGLSKPALIASAKGYRVAAPVFDEPAPQRPTSTRLIGNYPNPFNQSTEIKFHLSTASEVSLIVYNALGQTVRTLFSGYSDPGYYRFSWDGKGDQGQSLASGLYFYSLKTNHYRKTKKCLLLK